MSFGFVLFKVELFLELLGVHLVEMICVNISFIELVRLFWEYSTATKPGAMHLNPLPAAHFFTVSYFAALLSPLLFEFDGLFVAQSELEVLV